MSKVISVGIQKGGVGKSTTSSILAYHLAQQGYKVLGIDMDGQGNFTQLLTGEDDIYTFEDSTVYDAIVSEDASPYILKIDDNLHLLAGDENVNTLAQHFYLKLKGQYHHVLNKALESVKDQYDYIIIDNPPALGELSVISLTTSDFVLIMFETSKFCYNSLKSYMQTIEVVKEKVNPKLKIAGILRSMIDGRRADNKYYSNLVKEEFGDLCFNAIIKRTAVVGRVPALGLTDNPEAKEVMKTYKEFLKELNENGI
ncbi:MULTISPECIES: ParA family protein [Pontibacillus]|uniref:ParA family protein n=1 Tax=Pontibacillus chungwhensis TaxID=265426 RepID=A0ABY8V3J5_9BACI|nr:MULTISPECIES: ParA family protein [Pontibacillus]MCD5326160.1 ParA family protein [Pontibacillus sp. HN14]WIG00325.1 ParA family protein [Pontibacillus chungwhensis]